MSQVPCPICGGSGKVSGDQRLKSRLGSGKFLPLTLGFVLGALVATVMIKTLFKSAVKEAKPAIAAAHLEMYKRGLEDAQAVVDDAASTIRKAKAEKTAWYNLGSDKAQYEYGEKTLAIVKELLANQASRVDAAKLGLEFPK